MTTPSGNESGTGEGSGDRDPQAPAKPDATSHTQRPTQASATQASAIQVACPYCRTILSVDLAHVGLSLSCPRCQGVFQCPAPIPIANSAATASGGTAYTNVPFQNAPYPNTPYGAPYGGPTNPVQAFASKKVAAGICGILIGGLGIHKFVLGFNTAGILMLLTTVIGAVTGACLIVPILAPMAMGVIGLVEGILYLTKSDEEFYQNYAIQRREWF